MNQIKVNQTKPKISVILPVYNAEAYLTVCVQSILDQTYRDHEIIAVDDGSTDHSLAILKEFAATDDRLQVFSNDVNRGVAYTMNRAVNLSSGDYIAVMNADDIMHPTRLTKQLAFLETHPDHVLVGGQVRMISEMGEFLRHKNYPVTDLEIKKLLFVANPVQHSSALIAKHRLPEDFPWYEEQMKVSEDLDFLFKLAQIGKFAHLNNIVIDYRVCANSLSHIDPKRMYRLAYQARKRGMKKYGYQPDLKSRIFLESSLVISEVFPKRLLFPVFFAIRSLLLKLESLKQQSQRNQRTAKINWQFNLMRGMAKSYA